MNDFAALFKEVGANIQILGIAGICGAIVKAITAPEKRWRRRAVQGIAGAAAAVFLGPLVAHMLESFVDQKVYAWLAAGFICGYGGEAMISMLQNRLERK